MIEQELTLLRLYTAAIIAAGLVAGFLSLAVQIDPAFPFWVGATWRALWEAVCILLLK